MTRNARQRIEAVRQSKEQTARDAAYQAQCERDGLTTEQRRERALGTLADVAAAPSLAGVRRVYG